MILDHYVQWRWLLFFGLLFWLALIATDEFSRKILNKKLIEKYIDEDWPDEPVVETPPKTSPIEPVKVEDILLEKANQPIIDSGNIWRAVFAFVVFGLVVLLKYSTSNTRLELFSHFSPEDRAEVAERPLLPLIEETQEDNYDEIGSNHKPCLTPLSSNSRPSSRCMKSPSVDVRAVQAKLETLQKTIAAMKTRHAISVGIVSSNKDFQKLLTGLNSSERPTIVPQ